MKKCFKVSVFVVYLFLFSCSNDDPFSPTAVTVTETEAWPSQFITAKFDNPNFANFKIKFGSVTTDALPGTDGLRIVVPALPADQRVDIIMETPKGNETISKNFLIRGKPTLKYVAPVNFSYRVPLKAILENRDYYSGVTRAYFCPSGAASANCEEGLLSFSGDTIIMQPSLDIGNYTLKFSGTISFEADYADQKAYEALTDVAMTNVFTYSPSFHQVSSSGKAGSQVNIVFNDSPYYPDEMIVTLKSASGVETKLTNKGWDIVSTSGGYSNATFGAFEIPAIAPGAYTLIVKDKDNVFSLSEIKNTFTIIN